MIQPLFVSLHCTELESKMAFRLRVLMSALVSASQNQMRAGLHVPATGRVLHGAVQAQNRKYSADSPPYEEFNIQSTEDFNERVINSKHSTVVDFHASWCKPCHMLAPRLHEVLSQYPGRFQLAKVDVEKHTELAMDYDVVTIPKVVMVKEGKVAGQFEGLIDKDKIESFFERLTT